MKSQRNTQPLNTSSLSSMGYLTMIVALVPSVAGFSGMEQPLRNTASVASSTSPRTILRSSRSRRTTEPSITQLNYITEGSSAIAEPSTSSTVGHSPLWWNSIFKGREQSNAADDYLEFLDKRYNRLHSDEQQPKESKGFPVLNWLYQTGDAEAAPQKNHEEGALYVLGVANLASKKLLQKHHMLPEEDSSKDALETTAVVDSDTGKVSLLFRSVAHRRELFLRSQMRYTRLALALAVRTAVTGPVKATRKIYQMGGGRKSIALTVTALAALSFLVRPVVQVAASEATGGAISA